MTKQLNGDLKILVEVMDERMNNLKEYLTTEFKQNRQEHHELYTKANKNCNSITALKTVGSIGGAIILFILGILTKMVVIR
jgi:hypothetical protein